MRGIFFSILVVVCAATAVMALLLAPRAASWTYWLSIGWLTILVFGNWYSFAALFTSSKTPENIGSTGTDAILPGASLAFFVYSIFSTASILLFQYELLTTRVHLGVQIIAIATVAVVILLQIFASYGAGAGSSAAHSKRDLLDAARRVRLNVSADEITEVDHFLEYVEYRMAHPESLNQQKLREAMQHLSDSQSSKMDRIRNAHKALRSG